MNKVPTRKSRVLDADCPKCRAGLKLRLPRGQDEGEFSVSCHSCSTPLKVSVSSNKGSLRIDIKGMTKSQVHSAPRMDHGVEVVGPPKIDLDREKLPYKKRLRVAFIALLLVGALGVMSSLLTLSESFRIKDLEEQSPNDISDLNLWILDETSGRGVLGAKVSLASSEGNHTSVSDQEGLAIVPDVRIGTMELTIFKEGYRTVRGDVEIRKGTPNVLDIPLKRGDPEEVEPLPVQPFKIRTYDPLFTDLSAILMMLSALMAFVAAFFVHVRDFFLLALVASFLSFFSLGFFIGSVLAMLAFVIIILSYEGFEHSHYLKRYLDIYGKQRKDPMHSIDRRTGRAGPLNDRGPTK